MPFAPGGWKLSGSWRRSQRAWLEPTDVAVRRGTVTSNACNVRHRAQAGPRRFFLRRSRYDAGNRPYPGDRPMKTLKTLALIGLLAILGAIAAAVFFFGGYYSVAATVEDGPIVKWAKFSEGLRPDPPDLKELADERRPQDLFWVIKNGIHMTGMPSFGLIEVPDQEIWTIVAFVKKLPSVTDADFKAW